MEEQQRFECSPTSLKYKLKHTICGCFKHYPSHYDHLSEESPSNHHHQHLRQHPQLSRNSSTGGSNAPMMMRSSKSEEFNLKDKCRSLMSRMGTTPRGSHHHHRRSHSTDFHYDPLSYALNFEEEDAYEDSFPFRNFSSRLPASPPAAPLRSISDGLSAGHASSSDQAGTSTPVNAHPPREITAYS